MPERSEEARQRAELVIILTVMLSTMLGQIRDSEASPQVMQATVGRCPNMRRIAQNDPDPNVSPGTPETTLPLSLKGSALKNEKK